MQLSIEKLIRKETPKDKSDGPLHQSRISWELPATPEDNELTRRPHYLPNAAAAITRRLDPISLTIQSEKTYKLRQRHLFTSEPTNLSLTQSNPNPNPNQPNQPRNVLCRQIYRQPRQRRHWRRRNQDQDPYPAASRSEDDQTGPSP